VTQSGLSAALFGNMGPPSYVVTLPPGREWVYERAAWVFVAVAVAAAGLWVVRRRALRPAPRRALLWLAAGSLAVAYSGNWLWTHRDAGVVAPGLTSSLAVWMHGCWGVGAAVVVVAGWQRVRGGVSRAVAGRALALALATVVTALMGYAVGFEPALLLVLPGILVMEIMRGSDAFEMLGFFGVNVGLWWGGWVFFLRTRAERPAESPDPETGNL